MNNKLLLTTTLLIIFCSFTACKKTETTDAFTPEPPSTGANSLILSPDSVPVPFDSLDVDITGEQTATLAPSIVPVNAKVFLVGKGSGNLIIDGSKMSILGPSFIKIKGGKYNSILIKNLLGTKERPLFVKNEGLVTITGNMATDNISNVLISGDNTAGITYGFVLQNIAYRGLTMSGKMSGVTIRRFSFVNIGDNSITGSYNNGYGMPYDGTANTRVDDLRILYCSFDHAGSISFGGTLNNETKEDSGLFRNMEVAYNIFKNAPGVGSVCYVSNAQNYKIHHNKVDNINQNNNNHNGVFFMMGNGRFYSNKLTNYQGNAIRMWTFSRGSTPALCQIYNNVCYNTRKYGGFELQSFTRYMYPGKSTFVNAKVYNNTVGTMNTSKDWEGQILDLYNIYGTLEYYNNLGFNLVASRPITNMMNNMSNTKVIVNKSNKYLTKQSSAVLDVIHFVTKYLGIGAVGF
jgi:hypothetical protein